MEWYCDIQSYDILNELNLVGRVDHGNTVLPLPAIWVIIPVYVRIISIDIFYSDELARLHIYHGNLHSSMLSELVNVPL